MKRKDISIVQALLKQSANILPQDLMLDGDEIRDIDMTALLPFEYSYIMRAVPKRQWEFACGRKVSRRLLHRFDKKPVPILMDECGCPVWPTGITGSITHTGDYCLVGLGKQTEITSIGIDMENAGSVKPDLWPLLFTDKEIERLNVERDDATRDELATLLFTAKEAFYKCNYAIDKKWIDFKDVSVELDDQSNKISFLNMDGIDIGTQIGFSLIVSKYAVSIVWIKAQGF